MKNDVQWFQIDAFVGKEFEMESKLVRLLGLSNSQSGEYAVLVPKVSQKVWVDGVEKTRVTAKFPGCVFVRCDLNSVLMDRLEKEGIRFRGLNPRNPQPYPITDVALLNIFSSSPPTRTLLAKPSRYSSYPRYSRSSNFSRFSNFSRSSSSRSGSSRTGSYSRSNMCRTTAGT